MYSSLSKVFSSATRIIAIILTLALVGLTFKGIISGEQFMIVAVLAFKHFFDNSKTTVDKSTQPQG